jgi:pimeloyl-ACP methyl ester carboxylesterase
VSVIPRHLLRPATSRAVRVKPGLAGRWATDEFSDTRTLGLFPDDVAPFGARRFDVTGDPDVTHGFMWGSDGPTALLVHGWGADSSSMYDLVQPVRSAGLRVAAFDAPGHGIWKGSLATMAEYRRSIGAVLDTLGDVRVVVAHSVGALAALAALSQRPGYPVQAVVLLAPVATLSRVLDRWALVERRLSRAVLAEMYRELAHRNGVPTGYWDVARLGPPAGVPVLVLHDPADDVVPYVHAETISSAGPDVALDAVAASGHWRILSAASTREKVVDFLSAHVAPRVAAQALQPKPILE